jgi:hypothetical protein
MGRKKRQKISHSLYTRRTQAAYVRPLLPAAQRCLRLGSLGDTQERDRRGSNPRPPEPQSDVVGFWVLRDVAKPAYLSRFDCWRLRAVAECCALGGVRSGVNRYRKPLPWFALSHRVPRKARRCASMLAPRLAQEANEPN